MLRYPGRAKGPFSSFPYDFSVSSGKKPASESCVKAGENRVEGNPYFGLCASNFPSRVCLESPATRQGLD